ncbi:MAG TPA: ABC transporter ATP-binding protein [Chloroflexota bacterium]|nr:ABC transporter ATP-binding protein [Chloroflexota bacterium]
MSRRLAGLRAPARGTGWLLWRVVRLKPGPYFLDVALSVPYYCLPLVTGLVIRAAFDTLSGAAPATLGLGALLTLLVATEVGRLVVQVAYATVWVWFSETAGINLRRNLLHGLLYRHGARPLPGSPGDTVNRFRDDVDELVGAVEAFVDLVGQSVFALLALAVLLRIDAAVTVLVFVPLVGGVALANALGGRIKAARAASREASARVSELIGELFGAVQAVQVAGTAPYAVARFERLGDRRRQTAVQDRVLTDLLAWFNVNAVNLGIGVLLLVAAGRLRVGSLTLGDFALFVSYLGWLTGFPRWVGRAAAHYRQAEVSAARLGALLEGSGPDLAALVRPGPVCLSGALPAPPASRTPPRREAGDRLRTLEVRGLTYRYPGTAQGVGPVDLRLERGTLTVVTGEVGSGKSTLLLVLLGLLPAQGGVTLWNGRPVADPRVFFRPPRSAFTPQVPRLFSETLRDNILLGAPAGEARWPDGAEGIDGTRLEAALRLTVLEPDVAALEGGLETLVGPRGARLSGGQVQRAAAARMLVREPELLVVDDLSSALDVETEAALWEGLLALPGRTVLAVSHRREALRRTAQIVVLEGGQVAARGTLAQLLVTSPALRRLWETQR